MPEGSGLSDRDKTALHQITDAISQTERRAMEAERDTIDRYVAAWLSGRVGETFDTRITGVQGFGFFATIEKLGGDGLVPVSTLGREYFTYDEGAQKLVGERSGTEYAVGDRLKLKLAEANALTGALKFEVPDSDGRDRATRQSRALGKEAVTRRKDRARVLPGQAVRPPRQSHAQTGQRGRPGEHPHQGRKKK